MKYFFMYFVGIKGKTTLTLVKDSKAEFIQWDYDDGVL